MERESVPVDSATASRILSLVTKRLPATWRVMPIGGLGMMETVKQAGQLTRDVDLVLLLVLEGELRIPSAAEVMELARGLASDVRLREDQTSVEALVRDEAGLVKVEFIRGRNAQSGGYFVTRRVLEAAAARCRVAGSVLLPPPPVLALLKAWAATDQDKLVEAGKDKAGFHRARAAAFRQDVFRIRKHLLDLGEHSSGTVLADLLNLCPKDRATRVRQVLVAAGWEI